MDRPCSLSEFIEFVRGNQNISRSTSIDAFTYIEQDLGITGDDGYYLLQGIEQRFDITFAGSDGSLHEAFGLSDGQTIFHGETIGLLCCLANLFGFATDGAVALTVGQLYLATLRAIERKRHVSEVNISNGIIQSSTRSEN